jgi:hypothetical protein
MSDDHHICYFGVGAAAVATALELAGYVPARVYAGSVIEYAQRVGGTVNPKSEHNLIYDRWQDQGVSSYFQYHHDVRTHLSLNKDCPRPRPVHLPSARNVIVPPRSAVCIIDTSVELREFGKAAAPACPHCVQFVFEQGQPSVAPSSIVRLYGTVSHEEKTTPTASKAQSTNGCGRQTSGRGIIYVDARPGFRRCTSSNGEGKNTGRRDSE